MTTVKPTTVKWRPLLCRLGLHRWRWPKPDERLVTTYRCERCYASKIGRHG